MREPIVSIVKCKDHKWDASVLPAVCRAVDLIGGMESLVSLGDTVLLKPNLISEKDDSKTILIGTCMRKCKQNGKYIPGCPPHPVDFFDSLF